jgi:sec-independent protein translocase protein TatC
MAARRNPEKRMKLSGHLKELRKRLFYISLFIVAGGVIGWVEFEPVFAALQKPILALASRPGANATINFNSVVSAFDLRMQMSFFIGLVITAPLWLWQIWLFVSPALKKRERRYALGCYVAWISLPNFIDSMLSFTPNGTANVINAAEYVLFAVRVLVVFGVAFVLPVFLVLLNLIGVLTGRGILKGWRVALLLIAVIAAIATPVSDPMSMLLLMIPLAFLYAISGLISLANDKAKAMRRPKLIEADASSLS